MKLFHSLITCCAISTSVSTADTLPSLNVKDWLSHHSLYEGKYHSIGVNLEGNIEFFFTERGAKLNLSRPLELNLVIERREKSKDGKEARWVKKKIQKEDFIQPAKASENPESLTIHGQVTGDVKFKIDYTFTKESVLMKAAFVGVPKDAATAEYRLSITSEVERITSTISKEDSDDERAIKSKTRGCELRLKSRKGKPEKIRFYEKVDSAKLEKDEVTSIELRADKIGRKDVTWSLADPKQGKLLIEAKAKNTMPYDGIEVTTVLVDETGKKQSEGILLEYK